MFVGQFQLCRRDDQFLSEGRVFDKEVYQSECIPAGVRVLPLASFGCSKSSSVRSSMAKALFGDLRVLKSKLLKATEAGTFALVRSQAHTQLDL